MVRVAKLTPAQLDYVVQMAELLGMEWVEHGVTWVELPDFVDWRDVLQGMEYFYRRGGCKYPALKRAIKHCRMVLKEKAESVTYVTDSPRKAQ